VIQLPLRQAIREPLAETQKLHPPLAAVDAKTKLQQRPMGSGHVSSMPTTSE